jgi:hypothetical protein
VGTRKKGLAGEVGEKIGDKAGVGRWERKDAKAKDSLLDVVHWNVN